jgi:hypothetical protein
MRLFPLLLALALTGCFRIPVTVHPPHSADGQPLALPTAPTGIEQHADGTQTRLNPALPAPRPSDHPMPATTGLDLTAIMNLIVLLLGGGGIGGAMAMRGRARRAERSEDEVYQDLKRSIPTQERP